MLLSKSKHASRLNVIDSFYKSYFSAKSPVPSQDVASPVPRKVAPDTLPIRQRRMVSDEKRRALCESFDRDPYPSKYQREAMATLLDMDERRIKVSTSLASRP